MSEFSDLGLMAAREAARSHLADHLVQARTAHRDLLSRLHRFLVAHGYQYGQEGPSICIACGQPDGPLGVDHAPDCEWVALVEMTKPA